MVLQCCIVAFLMLTESKLKNWTIKYGKEEKVQQIMNQYKTFVSKNKIFQEFQKAFVEFKEVCDEYKRDGNIKSGEAEQIDFFINEVDERWKNTSTELRCVQSLLEEVLTYWQRWNANYEPLQKFIIEAFEVLKKDEDTRIEFFHDLSSWREKYLHLQDTVAFLVATSDNVVGQELRDKFMVLSDNWEQLFQYIEKYLHVGDINRTKKDYQEGLDKLDQWLKKAEDLLSNPQKVETQNIKKTLEQLMELHTEVGDMEEIFKSISRKFQHLVPELDQDEVENMMFVLKKEKENLVIIRSMIPSKIQLFHHLLSQLEAIDQGEKDILSWCKEVDKVVESVKKCTSQDELQTEYNKHKPFLSKTVNMQALLQSKNNVLQSILNNTEDKEDLDNSDIVKRMQEINTEFEKKLEAIKEMDQQMSGGIQTWQRFQDAQAALTNWLQEAQNLMTIKQVESKDNIDMHKNFFQKDSQPILAEYLRAQEALEGIVPPGEKDKIQAEVKENKDKWNEIQELTPIHLLKIEFKLQEEAMGKHVKEVERQIQDENLAFQKSENVAQIIQGHMDYFDNTDIVNKVEDCLKNMEEIKTKFNEKCPEDNCLQTAYDIKKEQWDAILAKIKSIFNQLEQIPEQWREYEKKFSEMVKWMDTVDNSFAKMFTGISSLDDFEREKQAFQTLCQDVDCRRNDMKWLVQKLDQLVSHRADDSGLSEQKRLEGLITRYKSMIPIIELNMVKVDVYSRSYAFREEAQQVMMSSKELKIE